MFFDLEFIDTCDVSCRELCSISGCDEVGRGPLAGPVVGATVTVDLKNKFEIGHLEDSLLVLKENGVTDSKKLTDKKRKTILDNLGLDYNNLKNDQIISLKIKKTIFKISIKEKSPDYIDKVNILNASLDAMKEAFHKNINGLKNGILLVDGNRAPLGIVNNFKAIPVIKGDSKSILIGLASIIAKIYRDELLKKFSLIYPGYGFEKHAGYPTKDHLSAIKALGPTPIHRKTFKGVKEYV